MNFENESSAGPVGEFRCLVLNTSFVVTRVDPKVQLLICSINTLAAVTATMANILVIISIWRSPALHSPSNVLLASLALSDLCVGLLVQPLFLVNNISDLRGFTELYCGSLIAFNSTGFIFCSVSVMTVTVLSLERYIAIKLHLRYREIVTVKRLIEVLVSVWIALIVTALLVMYFDAEFGSVRFGIAIVVLNFAITGFTYFMIYRVVRRHKAQIRAQLQFPQQWQRGGSSANVVTLMRSSWSMFLISLILGLCCLPYFVIRLGIRNPWKSSSTNSLITSSILLIYINSTLNPILYCWRFKKIRNAVVQTVKAVFKGNSIQ